MEVYEVKYRYFDKCKKMCNLYLILAPTIICRIASSSSFEIKSSLSKSYILNATEREIRDLTV